MVYPSCQILHSFLISVIISLAYAGIERVLHVLGKALVTWIAKRPAWLFILTASALI
jgi:hypothetical protein